MANIPGATVRFDLSPRVLIIPSPLVEATVQDIYDTCRDIEDEPQNMIYPSLISAAGKENLGGGVFVGITATLQNCVVFFEGRKISTSTGTITTADATGRVLIDSAGTLQTDSVRSGSWVVNLDDGSSASVLTVDGEGQATTDILQDGTTNQWQIGDRYKIWSETQCNIDGGNLVAVDENDLDISPILPSAGTQVVRTSSSSATLTDRTLITEAKYLIEGLRQSHGATGTVYYWDPVGGNDANSGLLPEQAVATFAVAQAKVVAGRHDAVFIVTTNSPGTLIINERITISKDALILRAFGSTVFVPPDDTAPTITVTADHVEVSSCGVMSTGATAQDAIYVSGARGVRLQDIRVTQSTAHGVHAVNCTNLIMESVLISNCTDDGFRLDDVQIGLLRTGKVSMCGGHGISLTSTTPGDTIDVSFSFLAVHDNTGGSVSIGAGVLQTVIQNTAVVDAAPDDLGISTRDYSLLRNISQDFTDARNLSNAILGNVV